MFKQRLSKLALATLLISATPFAIQNHSQVSAEVTNSNEASDLVLNSEQMKTVATAWITLGEFLADRQFTDEERAWIAKAEIGHFQKDPQKGVEGLESLKPVFSKIKALKSDPIQLARYREDLFATIHLNRVKSGNTDIQDYLTIVYRYSPVLVTDVEAGLVVTEKDIDSWYAANNFVSQLAFKTDYRSTNNIESVKQNFSSSYDNLSLEGKKLVAQAEGRWNALSTAWEAINSSTRQRFANTVADKTESLENVPKMTHTLQNAFYYTEEENAALASQNSNQLTTEQKVEEFKKDLARQRRAVMGAGSEAQETMGVQQFLIP